MVSSSVSPLFRDATLPCLAWLASGMTVGALVARRRTDPVRTETFFLGLGLALAVLELSRPNELAGVLTLVLPYAVVRLALDDRNLFAPGRWRRARRLVVVGIFVALLVASDSRGGWLWCAVALVAVFLFEGRRGRRLVAGAALPGIAVLAALGRDRLAAFWLYGGDLGLPLEKLLTGRPEIWHRALRALADVPMTGYGLGTFGPVVGAIYPTAIVDGPVDDAHNLFLDSAFALGLPGFLALAGLLAVAFHRLLGSAGRREHARGRRLALLAALLGHTLYSLTDAVALGTRGNVLLWCLLGMISASTVRPRWRPRRPVTAKLAAVAAGVAVLLAAAVALLPVLRLNIHATRAVRAVLTGGDPSDPRVELLHLETCRAWWLVGHLDQAAGDLAGRDAAWAEYLSCADDVPAVMTAAVPDHRELARHALVRHPESAAASFWAARTVRDSDPEDAVALYRRGLAIDPSNGRAWIELGDLLIQDEPVAALGAYVEGCRHGDPGLNGCWRAGQAAERLGEIDLAIRTYRRSRWQRARQRAEEIDAIPSAAP